MFLTSVCILVLLGLTSGTSFEGYKVYKITAKSTADNEFLQQLKSEAQFDFWSKINKVGKPVAVMVPPHIQEKFEQDLATRKITYSLEIDNVQRTVDAEKTYHQSKQPLKNGRIAFDQYLRHSEINAYLDQLARDYPHLVSVSTVGQSYQNRTMKQIRIYNGVREKPVIFIEGGMHAREWISPALSLYIIYQLVENPDNSYLLDNLDWVILPVMNPDGYEYTWTSNRMWRKTRSPGLLCDGTDGNRNFGFHWMGNGASDNECSEIFAGKSAFSEVEAQNLRDLLDETEDIRAFISIHSYGQYLFYPYSYDYVKPDNWRELEDLANRVNDVISAINGTEYTVGNSADVLYPAAGCSDDWAIGGAGIDMVYVFELPGGGQNGFDLPPTRILPVSIETWEGIKVIANYLAQNV